LPSKPVSSQPRIPAENLQVKPLLPSAGAYCQLPMLTSATQYSAVSILTSYASSGLNLTIFAT